MPEEIKSFYFENLSKFEKKQRSIALTLKFILFCVISFGIGIALLVFVARIWDNWQWLGLKGIVAASMFFLPICIVTLASDNDQRKMSFSMSFVFLFWDIAILTLSLPSWNEYSWMGLKTVIVSIVSLSSMLLFGCVSGYRTKKRFTRVYMSDFDRYSSQSEEYIKFKEAKSK